MRDARNVIFLGRPVAKVSKALISYGVGCVQGSCSAVQCSEPAFRFMYGLAVVVESEKATHYETPDYKNRLSLHVGVLAVFAGACLRMGASWFTH